MDQNWKIKRSKGRLWASENLLIGMNKCQKHTARLIGSPSKRIQRLAGPPPYHVQTTVPSTSFLFSRHRGLLGSSNMPQPSKIRPLPALFALSVWFPFEMVFKQEVFQNKKNTTHIVRPFRVRTFLSPLCFSSSNSCWYCCWLAASDLAQPSGAERAKGTGHFLVVEKVPFLRHTPFWPVIPWWVPVFGNKKGTTNRKSKKEWPLEPGFLTGNSQVKHQEVRCFKGRSGCFFVDAIYLGWLSRKQICFRTPSFWKASGPICAKMIEWQVLSSEAKGSSGSKFGFGIETGDLFESLLV